MIHNTKISIIAAIGRKRELGKSNKLLWDIPEDLKRFRQLTQGHAVIMGRKTFESIGRLLPNRYNIVITRDLGFKINALREGKDFAVVNSLEEALKKSIKYYVLSSKYKNEENKIHDTKHVIHDTDEVFVIGGGQIYEQSISLADKLYLTIVDGSFDADTFFPDYSQFKKVVFEKEGESGGYKYKFLEFER